MRGLARRVALDRQHAHAERLREPRGLGPDLAEADDQQRAVAQLADGLLARRPVALALVGEQLRQVLGEREQPEQRELRQRPGVHAARRRHDHVLELAGGEAQRVAQLLAGAGVAGLHPAQRGRAADDVDEPLGAAARDPEHHLRALQRLLPARVVERDAALAVAVPVPARAREQLGQVGQPDPVVGVRDPLGELRPEERAGDQDLHRYAANSSAGGPAIPGSASNRLPPSSCGERAVVMNSRRPSSPPKPGAVTLSAGTSITASSVPPGP